MAQGCFLLFTTAQINVLLNSTSVVLSLKYIFPILFHCSSKIFRQYFYLDKKISVSASTSKRSQLVRLPQTRGNPENPII